MGSSKSLNTYLLTSTWNRVLRSFQWSVGTAWTDVSRGGSRTPLLMAVAGLEHGPLPACPSPPRSHSTVERRFWTALRVESRDPVDAWMPPRYNNTIGNYFLTDRWLSRRNNSKNNTTTSCFARYIRNWQEVTALAMCGCITCCGRLQS